MQEQYCNLGRSLAAGDVSGDGFPDLLMGSPFAGGQGDQRGLVTALVSSKKYRGTVCFSRREGVGGLVGPRHYSDHFVRSNR